MTSHRSILVVVACAALTTVLGSIHAFSVFVPQWEISLNASRASVSFIYSLSLMTLTLAVLVGYRIYARSTPVMIFLVTGFGAALGLYFAASSQSLIQLYVSYGVLFGGANGLGYGFALQLAGQSVATRPGLAMSLVTAFYAVGATVSPILFVRLINVGDNSLALMVMSGIVIGVALLAALGLHIARASYHSENAANKQKLPAILQSTRWRLWFAYGCAVLSGLMAIGHAYNIAVWMGFAPRWAAAAPVCVAVGNMLGGFSAGALADRLPSRKILCWLPLLSAAALLLLSGSVESTIESTNQSTIVVGLLGLTLIGYAYGALIAVYPVAITQLYGSLAAARVYGQIFTAWGLAGLFGPSLSGWLFDQHMTYLSSLIIAMCLAIVSFGIIRFALPAKLQWSE